MMNRSGLTEQQIASIADVLANCHDWDTANLLEEIEGVLDLKDSALKAMIGNYLSLDASIRLAPGFDHRQFVLEFQSKGISN